MNDLSPTRGTTLDGKKLRELRSQRALSQEHLAGIAGVSDDTISRAERGQSISFDNARAIAAAFNTDLAALIPATVLSKVDAPSRETHAVAMSNIPIRVPTHFMGREDALDQIHKELAAHQGRVAITALHGLRGVGKTVLAAAYAERHAKDYRATRWIRAETESGMRADLVGLGVRLGWVDPEEKEEPVLAAVMERLTQNGDGILLVYDNAVEASAIRPYLPRGGAARVLVTSNAHAWRGIAAPIQIGVWPKEIGADFLVARTGRTAERAAAEALSEALGGLPLAREQAAAYCERLEIPLSEYACRFAAEPARLLDAARDAPTEYHDKLTVAKTFALAIDAAAKLHPTAGSLIVYCALLAPEPIPLFLFAETLGKPGGPLEGDALDEAVAALRAFALVDKETIADEHDPSITTETLRLHRLVREVAATRAGHARLAVSTGLIRAMASVYPGDIQDNPAGWPRARRLDPIATALISDGSAVHEDAEAAAIHLMNKLATYREFVLADYAAARPLFERALSFYEEKLGPEHPNTLTSVNNLAGCLLHLGDAAAALSLNRRALEAREQLLEAEDPRTLTSVNNLAHCLEALGDAAAALPLYRRALEGREQVLGPEHPDTLSSVADLANCLIKLGDATAALPLHRRALEVRHRVLGAEHPDTLGSVNSLAGCLYTLGDAAAALPLCRRAAAGYEKILGPDHPDARNTRLGLTILEAASGGGSHPSS